MPRRTLLIVCPVYVPDPAAVGQHVADAASELARRGNRVVVLTANRGYDDPTVRYPAREWIDGVEVHRLPASSFGKSSLALRLLASVCFVLQSILRGLLLARVDGVLVTTATSLTPLAALLVARARRVPLTFWVMDLNPDQLIALGILRPGSLPARGFDAINRAVLGQARDVVVLDRFMAERVTAKAPVMDRISVIPPWPLDTTASDSSGSAAFRATHGLQGKLVVMYSGNHGPSNPFDTVLAAADRLTDLAELVFVFVGGGVGKKAVDQPWRANVLSLPYQPLAHLRNCLAAADLHLVTMGDAMPGIVHPCKVYGAMAVSRPILLLGPAKCHVGDLLAADDIGWRIAHGDVDGAERLLRELVGGDRRDLEARGRRGQAMIDARLSRELLRGQLCDVVERGLRGGSPPAAGGHDRVQGQVAREVA